MASQCISTLTIKRGVPVVHVRILPGTGVDCNVVKGYVGFEKHHAVVDSIFPTAAVPVASGLVGGNDDLAPLKNELSSSPDRRVALVATRRRGAAIGRGACREHLFHGGESRFIIRSSFGGTD